MNHIARILISLFLSASIVPGFGQSEHLTQNNLRADFDTLCRKLETIHADLYVHQSPEEYQAQKAATRQAVKDMTPEEFYLTIAPFVASIGDGHTSIAIPIEGRKAYLNRGGKTLPLRLRVSQGKLFVDFPLTATREAAENDEITVINGVPSADIVRRLYALNGADRIPAIHDNSLTLHLSTLLWLLYHWENNYDMEIKTADTTRTVHLPGITQAEALPVLKTRLGHPVHQFIAEVHPEKHTAHLTIKNFYDLQGLTAFCDSIFPVLRREQITGLTIDIRGNSGGSSRAAEKLISYLSHDAYQTYSRHDLKISRESKAYNRQLHPDLYEQIRDLPEGTTYTQYCDTIPDNRRDGKAYRGQVTVLTDESTYSAACTFATLIGRSKAGRVIGPTGCTPVMFGNFIAGKLPHSGLSYYIAFKKFYE